MFSKARLKFDDIFENRLEHDEVREYLIELYNRGETADEIAAAATAMREHLLPSNEYDFISRYFWPANGGNEDPVTGSIHTGLAPYWAQKLNKNALKAFQASKRGGVLLCNVTDENVILLGKAVKYLEGYIEI